MDIPLPDEIPLPSGGGDDNQPGPPGEGPPLPPPRPMGRGGFQRLPGPPMPPRGPQMMFRGSMPPFNRPPPVHSNSNSNARPSSERYSPSRVTGDDDEKEQMSISALFEQEQTHSHSHQPSIPVPPQTSSHTQQSISAIFDSFLTPPPQTHHPPPQSGHNQGPGPGYPSMPPPYMAAQHHHPHLPHGPPPPVNGPLPGTGPPGGPPYLGPPGIPPHHGPPGTGGPLHGPPQFGPPGTGPPCVPPPHGPPGTGPPGGPPYHGPPGAGGPPHHGPPGTGPHGGPPPHVPPGTGPPGGPPYHGPPGPGPPGGPPHPGPYFSHPPPFPPFTSAPPFTPNTSSSGPGNNVNTPYSTPARSSTLHFQNSKSKASKILKSFNTPNKFQSQLKDITSGDSTADTSTADDTPVVESVESVHEAEADSVSKTPENLAVDSSEVPAVSAPSDSVATEETPAPGSSSETLSVLPDTKIADTESEVLKSSDDSSVAAVPDSVTSSGSLTSTVPSTPSAVTVSAADSDTLNSAPPLTSVASMSSVSITSAVISTLNSTISTSDTSSQATSAQNTENTGGAESNDKPVKKTMPKVLGKQGAKKRLLSYTGKLSSFALSKSTKPLSSTSLEEEDDTGEKKKAAVQTKKKKKEEKMSSIEQIRNEESRIKEALGLKNVLFSPYGPGLAPITKLLDNPEELRKFEVRGKEAKIKLEEYGERSKLREREEKEKEKRREKERERERRRRREKEHDREKEKENERTEPETKSESHSKEDEETKTDTKGDQEESKKKTVSLPKTWKEFKAGGFDLESLKVAWREEERRRRSRSQDRTRSQGGHSRERSKTKLEDTEPYGQQNLFIHPVHMVNVNGLRLQYPAKLVQFTKALPSISYGINHYKYDMHYSTRLEIKRREPPEIWEIMKDYWAAKPLYAPHKKRSKGKLTRPWFGDALEEMPLSKSQTVVANNEESESAQKLEKSKKSSSHRKSGGKDSKTNLASAVPDVGQEVAKAATKSKWDSDIEEEGETSLRNLVKEKEVPSSKSEVDKNVDDKADDDKGLHKSEGLTNVDVHTSDSSGKVFSEGLNEEYEAFLEMLGGEQEVKTKDVDAGDYPDREGVESVDEGKDGMEDDDGEKEMVENKEERHEDAFSDVSDGEIDSKIPLEKHTEKQYASEEAKLEGAAESDKKKDKAEKKLKKQLKKAKKKQKKARKKAKKKAKKATKKKKLTKKDSKKGDKKAKSDASDDESDKSVIHVEDDDPRQSSDRRREESADSRGSSEERQKEYSQRNRDSADRSSEERSDYLERRRRESPDRGDYDRRRGYDGRRDFKYRRGGGIRDYSRGGGGDWRRDDFGDYRGRPRGRGGYDRRGRGRGFMRDFRDRRESFRDRRIDSDDRREEDRMYERTEDYEVHREFIREKRFERKEALEEGRDLRKERLERRESRGEKHKDKDPKIIDDLNDMLSYSPVRTISDESDSDDKSVEWYRDGDEDLSDEGRKVYHRSQTDGKILSGSPSPRRRGSFEKDTPEDDSDEEIRVKSKKGNHWDREESNTGDSWKSRDSSPSHTADDITNTDNEKAAIVSHYPTSDTSGYYDLSSAQSPLSEADSLVAEEEPDSPKYSKKSVKGKKGVDIKLDDIPYPPGGPPADNKKEKSQISSPNDRYSPSNMSLSGSPSSSSPPYNFPQHSQSPSLEIPLPPSVESIPVPPAKRSATGDSSILKTDLKGICIPPAGIPLPSDPLQQSNKIASVMPVPSVHPQSAFQAMTKCHAESKESFSVAESQESPKAFMVQPTKSHDPYSASEMSVFPVSDSVKGTKSPDCVEVSSPDYDSKDLSVEESGAESATTKWVEKSVDESNTYDAANDDRTKNSRSMPITFRLGGSKQSTMKLLQRGSLPEFDHEEEEEEKLGPELERDSDDDDDYKLNTKRTFEEELLKEASDMGQVSKSSLPGSPQVLDNVIQEDNAEKTEKSDSSKSDTPDKSQSLSRSTGSPQRSKNISAKDVSPSRHPSHERSKSPRGSRTSYRSKSPPRSRSPYRSRSPQRNRSPKRNKSPKRTRDSRSRSLSPRRMGGRRSPPRKRRVSPEHRRFRGSPERSRRRDFTSPPRKGGRWPRDGRSPPSRSAGPRGGKERRSPRRFSRSPSPIREDRFASPDSRHSRTPDKGHAPISQGPRTPEGPDKIESDRSPLGRLASPQREREFWGNRSPDRAPSPDAAGRRMYPSPQGRKNRKDYRSSRSPSSRSPERWASRRHSPGRRSPKWSPERHRTGSPGSWRSPPYRSPERRTQYSPGRDKISPNRRWSPRRSRSPRRSPLRKSPSRKSPPRRPLTHRSASRSPIRRSRSRSPVCRSSSRSPVRRSPLRRSPRWSRSPSRRSPLRRSPARSPIRRSPGRRSPLRRSPSSRSPRRSPRGSRSPSKDFDYDRHEKEGWSNWKWEHDQVGEHREQERWPVRPPSPKEEPSRDKYYRKKIDRKESTLKIDADSTISDSELTIKKEPVDSTSSSPPDSPRRLSLDERLQREHGVEIEDHSKKKRPVQQAQPSLYNWGYQAHPVQVHQFQYAYEGSGESVAGESGSSEGSSRVIQVGNMLQVLPQESPMIVQTGNVIQVVPAENMQMLGADVVPGIPVSSGGVMGMGGVVQVVTGGVVGMTGSSPTPVPAPVTQSPSKLASEESTAAAVSSVLSSLSSSIQLPGASSLAASVSQVSHSSSSFTPVTTLATNSGVTATSTTHAAGLPVAHLISLLQQQQMAGMTESVTEQEAKLAKEKAREERKERKEKRRLEREARREARQKEKEEARRRAEAAAQESQEKESNDNSDTEDEVLIREAIYEVPNIGSPVPEYEIMREEESDEDDEDSMTKKKRRLPIPLPPAEKGILMSPSFRYRREEYHPKAVKFADGILPGEGTSPSGGEEIHSPPPPDAEKPREKKLRKRRKVKVKIIKQYNVNDEDDDSPPPPPPGSPPPLAALKLYPGYTHYSYTAPGTVVIYAQQPQQAYAYAPGQAQGAAVTVPGGMVIQQGSNTQPQAIGSLGGVQPSVFRYPGYVYTTVYSAGQQLQYVLPTPLTSQATTSTPPKLAKK